ncbi:4-hydroxythreonine-4-phosphate dehydrogenase PdxA [Rhodopirellula sp. P2]|uniref:4-hydroxythreonine-4-phosphate dehydrogenase PdxA n=1 Tax=Rhodopirellula sp. P2 TaxID=2127060 RepID=UPI002368D468|nr:4-hydroxythreonine-4-phosphate dehydrogenase PdxA [Rhodopirellula sp. P2]WDQ18444.1 4-hydroxythreonine-4-phosphate dehydrogenase PdxA [Rhodopirellula sp. P2]
MTDAPTPNTMHSTPPPQANRSTPQLAITIGDAAGIGPEVALRVWDSPEVQSSGIPLLFGDAAIYQRAADQLGCDCPDVISLADFLAAPTLAAPSDAPQGRIVDCGKLTAEELAGFTPGKFSAATGRASYRSVTDAIDAAVSGHVDAIVTGPIQKEAWHQAGIDFPGHTELLADRAGRAVQGKPADVRMMLASDTIACVLETIHIPLADVASQLNTESLVRTIHLAGETVQRRNQRRGSLLPPRIAVCGLNPHAGENGLFSHQEEEQIILPAIETARQAGWTIEGPLSPDTAFTPAMRERIDIYVCMYHDQGLIPLKALSFDDAVNVTLGLPIIRTSVDHGTAMDLAWQGKASVNSMLAAIRWAIP